VAYVVVLVLWQVLRRTVGEAAFPVMVLNYAGVWPFALTPLLAAWMGLSGNLRPLPLLALPLALFAWRYGAQLLPPAPQAAADAARISVLTHNVRFDNPHVGELATAYLAVGADVLALQEVMPQHERGLSEALAPVYPYRAYLPEAGLAVYSRHPLVEVQAIELEPWPAQRMVVEADGRRLALVNAHLTPVGVRRGVVGLQPGYLVRRAADRTAQAEAITQALQGWEGPAVLACDCNAPENSEVYARLTDALTDSFRVAGWGFGHSFLVPRGLEVDTAINLPVIRLDYLFYRGGLSPLTVDVLEESARSDHLPVLATFAWPSNNK
jgi:vancomycin resistance protein VanJ